MTVRFHELAAQEIDEAFAYYERDYPGRIYVTTNSFLSFRRCIIGSVLRRSRFDGLMYDDFCMVFMCYFIQMPTLFNC